MGVFEFGQFIASENYIADQKVLNEALDLSCKADGFLEYIATHLLFTRIPTHLEM